MGPIQCGVENHLCDIPGGGGGVFTMPARQKQIANFFFLTFPTDFTAVPAMPEKMKR